MISERTADVDGTPVRWLEQGTGLPVVLVHGIPTSPTLWRHVLPQLTGLRVLAFEMTGYGESIPAGRDRDISVGAQADRLNAWLAQLGIERAVLVGHDLGGGVGHIAAVREPQRCAGLLITNGIAYDSWPIPSVKVMRAAAPLLAMLPAIALKPALNVADGTVLPVASVLWCTGFRPDTGWIEVSGALDPTGAPLHDKGAAPVPGLHWMGLPWQTRLNSSIIDGVDRDARRTAKRTRAGVSRRHV